MMCYKEQGSPYYEKVVVDGWTLTQTTVHFLFEPSNRFFFICLEEGGDFCLTSQTQN